MPAHPAGAIERTAPATYGQRSEWYDHMGHPPERRHLRNLHLTWQLPERRSQAAVARALNTLLHRHEGLRTTLSAAPDGELRQRVHEPLPPRTAYASAPRPESGAIPFVRELRQAAFDLETDTPVRFGLLGDENGQVWQVHTVVHHSALDALGRAVLVEEFQQLLDLPDGDLAVPPGRQPADIAAWERSPAGLARHRRCLEYVRGQLRSAPAPLFGPPSAGTTARGRRERRMVSLQLRSPALRAAARRLALDGHSLTAMMLGAYAGLLGLCAGHRRVMFAVMVANRFAPGTDRSVACLSQPSLVTLAAEPSADLGQTVARAQSALIAAYRHGGYDAADAQRIIAEAGAGREPVTIDRLIDCLDLSPAVGDRPPTAAELDVSASELQVSEPYTSRGMEQILKVRGRADAITLWLLMDIDCVAVPDARHLLLGVESALAAAARGDRRSLGRLAADLPLPVPAAR